MLIEIRMGPSKLQLKRIIYEVAQKCRLHKPKYHRVPHLTLFGNFSAHGRTRQVLRAIEESCRNTDPLEFCIDGYESKKTSKGWVVAFKIKPSDNFLHFRNDLTEKMMRIVQRTKGHDFKNKPWFHITIAYKLSDNEYSRVWRYLHNEEPGFFNKIILFLLGKKQKEKRIPRFHMNGLRVTLLNDRSKIMYEYDLLQKKFLNRSDSLSKQEWRKTLSLSQHRPQDNKNNSTTLTNRTFIISDLHLNHANIIKYCKRPFKNLNEMNRTLIDNWNSTIRKNDTVYFLGDLAFSRGSGSPEYWLNQLNGNIIFIKGNHDRRIKNAIESHLLKYKGHEFLLVHSPNEIPQQWNGWVMHGHKHNNSIGNYPFINGEKKTINVSVEVLDYKPLNLDYLISLDYKRIKRKNTIKSVPEFF